MHSSMYVILKWNRKKNTSTFLPCQQVLVFRSVFLIDAWFMTFFCCTILFCFFAVHLNSMHFLKVTLCVFTDKINHSYFSPVVTSLTTESKSLFSKCCWNLPRCKAIFRTDRRYLSPITGQKCLLFFVRAAPSCVISSKFPTFGLFIW